MIFQIQIIDHDEQQYGLQRISNGGKKKLVMLSKIVMNNNFSTTIYHLLKNIFSFNKTGFDFVRSNDINVGNIMNIFSAAFKVWETYTCLTFHQVDNLMDADIEIKFER